MSGSHVVRGYSIGSFPDLHSAPNDPASDEVRDGLAGGVFGHDSLSLGQSRQWSTLVAFRATIFTFHETPDELVRRITDHPNKHQLQQSQHPLPPFWRK